MSSQRMEKTSFNAPYRQRFDCCQCETFVRHRPFFLYADYNILTRELPELPNVFRTDLSPMHRPRRDMKSLELFGLIALLFRDTEFLVYFPCWSALFLHSQTIAIRVETYLTWKFQLKQLIKTFSALSVALLSVNQFSSFKIMLGLLSTGLKNFSLATLVGIFIYRKFRVWRHSLNYIEKQAIQHGKYTRNSVPQKMRLRNPSGSRLLHISLKPTHGLKMGSEGVW